MRGGQLPQGLAPLNGDGLGHRATDVSTAGRVLTGDGELVAGVEDRGQREPVGIGQSLRRGAV